MNHNRTRSAEVTPTVAKEQKLEKLVKSINGLSQIFYAPGRYFIFKFTAKYESQSTNRKQQPVKTTSIFSSAAKVTTAPNSFKCIIFLFNDSITVCTEKKVEFSTILYHSWVYLFPENTNPMPITHSLSNQQIATITTNTQTTTSLSSSGSFANQIFNLHHTSSSPGLLSSQSNPNIAHSTSSLNGISQSQKGREDKGVPFRLITPEKNLIFYVKKQTNLQVFVNHYKQFLIPIILNYTLDKIDANSIENDTENSKDKKGEESKDNNNNNNNGEKKLKSIGVRESDALIQTQRKFAYEFLSKKKGFIYYDGEWKDGKFSGKGKLLYVNYEYYDGTFCEGLPHGFGSLYFASPPINPTANNNNNTPNNNNINNTPNNNNNNINSNNNMIVNNMGGNNNNSSKNFGNYSMIKINGLKYEGYWEMGMRHGKGTYHYPIEDPHYLKFIGSFDNDKQQGDGELHLKNSNIIKARWKVGMIVAPVSISYFNPSAYFDAYSPRTPLAVYVGDISFVDNQFKRDGHGVCVYENKDRYYGRWLNDSRHGHGVIISSNSTKFNGEWVMDRIEGNGVLTDPARSTHVGRFIGVWDGHLEVNAVFHLNRTNDRQSNRSANSTSIFLNNEKWDVLFKLRLATEKENNFANYSEEAILLMKNLFASLVASQAANYSNPSAVFDDLRAILNTRTHPLGSLIIEFHQLFTFLYRINLKEPNVLQKCLELPNAVDDIKSFISLLSADHLKNYLRLTVEINKEVCELAVNHSIFPAIYQTLFALYQLKNEEKNNKLEKSMRELRAMALFDRLAVCAIDKSLWENIELSINEEVKVKAIDLNPSPDLTPFQTAVGALRKMPTYQTAPEKLDCLKTAATYVEQMIKNVFKKPFGADEFLPFFCLVMMESNPPHLESECNFIEDFMPEEGRNSMPGYLLAQLQITSSFICDYKNQSLRK